MPKNHSTVGGPLGLLQTRRGFSHRHPPPATKVGPFTPSPLTTSPVFLSLRPKASCHVSSRLYSDPRVPPGSAIVTPALGQGPPRTAPEMSYNTNKWAILLTFYRITHPLRSTHRLCGFQQGPQMHRDVKGRVSPTGA